MSGLNNKFFTSVRTSIFIPRLIAFIFLFYLSAGGFAWADVLSISTTSPLPNATLNYAYNTTINAAGGTQYQAYVEDEYGPYLACTGYVWTKTNGTVPPGLALSSTTGNAGGWSDQGNVWHADPLPGQYRLSGTPTANGAYTFTLQAADYTGTLVTREFTITVNIPVLAITTNSLSQGTLGAAYNAALTATGGITPYTWSITSGTLQAGLSLNSSTGVISGTPTASGTSNLTFQVSSTDGQNVTKNLSLTIASPCNITTTSPLPNATLNSSYNTTINAAGGTQYEAYVEDEYGRYLVSTGYIWSLISGTVPPGLTLTSTTGTAGGWSDQGNAWHPDSLPGQYRLSGTPTVNGAYTFTLKALDYTGTFSTKEFTITVGIPQLSITTNSLPQGTLGAAYSTTLTATGGITPYSWSITSGTLQAGLSLNSSTGAITGTPTAGGNSALTFQVSSSDGQNVTKNLSLTIANPCVITTTSPLPDATLNSAYNMVVNAANGTPYEAYVEDEYGRYLVSTGYIWSLENGTVPPGMTLSSTAGTAGGWYDQGNVYHPDPLAGQYRLSGTPTSYGTYTFSLKAADYTGTYATVQFSLTVNIPVLSITTNSLPQGTLGAAYSTTLSATGGITPYAWSITSGTLQAGLILNSSTGQISGTPTAGGTANLTIQATSSDGQNVTKNLSLVIAAPCTITTASPLPNATLGAVYNVTISAESGTPYEAYVEDEYGRYLASTGYIWSLESGTISSGMTLTSTSGSSGGWSDQANVWHPDPLPGQYRLNGTPTSHGTYTFTLKALDYTGTFATKEFSLTVVIPPLAITTATLSPSTQGIAYNKTVTATGGLTPYTWSITEGALQAGLSFDTNTGAITGTPTASGTSNLTFQVTSSDNQTVTKPLSLVINPSCVITSAGALAEARIGVAYNQTINAAYGTLVEAYTEDEYGTYFDCSGYLWTLESGTLPPGLTLGSTNGSAITWVDQGNVLHSGAKPGMAKLSGTPSQLGIYTFTLKATDYVGSQSSIACTLTVNYNFNITSGELPKSHKDIPYSYTITATGAPTPYTWSISAGSLPPYFALNANTGEITGVSLLDSGIYTFTAEVHGTDATLNPVAQKQFTIELRPTWDNLSGGYHKNEDWTVADGSLVGGEHYGVKKFSIPAGSTVTMQTGSGMIIDSQEVDIEGTLKVNSQGTLEIKGNNYINLYPGSVIDLRNLNYNQPDDSTAKGGDAGNYLSGAGGGGYGGVGGAGGGANKGLGGIQKGTVSGADIEKGSKGGNVPDRIDPYGGMGGYAIFSSGNDIIIGGQILANGNNGQDGTNAGGGGGGSGGGILISGARVTIGANAELNVCGGNGGNGTNGGGGGGGGRIKIFATQSYEGPVPGPDNSSADLRAKVNAGAGGTAVQGGEAGQAGGNGTFFTNVPVQNQNGGGVDGNYAAKTPDMKPPVGDEVWPWDGRIYILQTDFIAPGRGLSAYFERTYTNSVWYDGPLGFGWSHNYNTRFKRLANGNIQIHWAMGNSQIREDIYESSLGSAPLASELPFTYDSPRGFFETLVENPDRTFTRTFANGVKEYFDIDGKLVKIQDTSFNEINLSYNSFGLLTAVTDTLGKTITFSYTLFDRDYRLTSVADSTGRTWIYSYSNGDLVSVTTPSTTEYPNGLTSSFAYDAQHNLLTLTDGKGQTYTSTTYDASQNFRITGQVYGTGTFNMEYPSPGTTARVRDRNNNLTEQTYDALGNLLEIKQYTRGIYPGEPAFYSTQYEYNIHYKTTKITLPEGNIVLLTYDDTNADPRRKGNLLEIRRKSLNTLEPDIVNSFTYESRFNRIKTSTDERGYITNFYYDYEEETLGDLNGDGITTQTAGNLVKIQYPQTTRPDLTTYTPEEYFRYNQYGQLIRAIDPEGYVTIREYYPAGHASHGYLKSITRDYSSPGEIDPKTGNAHLNLTYNFDYDIRGNLTSVSDAKGQLSTFEINALNQITKTISRQLTNPSGGLYNLESSMSYDENGNIVTVRVKNYDENGALYAGLPEIRYDFTYDILDNMKTVTAQVDANKFVTMTYDRDANENLTKVTMPENNFNTFLYDERDLVYKAALGADNPAEQMVTNYTYTANGQLKTSAAGNTADPNYGRGKITNYYDNFNRLFKVMDEINNYTEFVFDGAGFLKETKRVDYTGKILSHGKLDYDELGRAYKTENYVESPNLPVQWALTQIFMDKNGRTEKVIDAKNHQAFFTYDGINRLVKAIDELGNTVETEYDANSNPTKITETENTTDPDTGTVTSETFVTQNIFDPLDRLIKVIDNAQNFSEVKYDGRSNVVWAKDREGNTIVRKYDGLSRLTDTIYQMRAGGTGAGVIEREITVSGVYDDNSRLVQQKDGRGNITAFSYDSVDRMKTKTLPDGTQSGYFYKPEGVLDYYTDANGSTVTFGYDNALRMIHKAIQKGIGVEGTATEDYWYDGANRLTSASNDYSTVTRKYNSLGEVYEETQAVTINAQTQMKTVRTEFDVLGNRTALEYPSGKRITYTHDALDRVKDILNSTGGAITQYNYQGPDRVKSRTNGNSTKLSIAYDAMKRITSYQTTDNTQNMIAGFGYGYNKEGMRTYENYLPGIGETNQNSRGKVFTYDSLYQVTGVKYDVSDPIAELQNPGTQTYSRMIGYQIDNAGNRENVTTTPYGQTPVTQTYQTNSLNQYTSIDSSIFGYDSEGNMTSGIIYLDDSVNPGQKTPVQANFVYDYQNELVKVTRSSDSRILGEYVYDALGRRIYKKAWDEVAQTNVETWFWHDGAECVEETGSAGAVVAAYTFGIGIDETVCVEYPVVSMQYPQAGTYWYHTDVLSSVVAVTDNNGNVVERYKYDIYGEATILASDGQTVLAESLVGNRLLFTGREYDSETGLYYYRARYYHAQIDRFISADPLGMDGLGNLFAYVSNSPMNWTDPYGLVKQSPAGQPVASWSRNDPRLTPKAGYNYSPVGASKDWENKYNQENAVRGKTEQIRGVIRRRIGALISQGAQDSDEFINLVNADNWLRRSTIETTSEWKKSEILNTVTYADWKIVGVIGLYGSTWEELAQEGLTYKDVPVSTMAETSNYWWTWAKATPEATWNVCGTTGTTAWRYWVSDPEWLKIGEGAWNDISLTRLAATFGVDPTYGIRTVIDQISFGTPVKGSTAWQAGQYGKGWQYATQGSCGLAIVTAGIAGFVVVIDITGYSAIYGIHSAHHTFGALGKMRHIQIVLYKAGVNGSHIIRRIPFWW